MSGLDDLTREELIAIILKLNERVTALESENEELRSRLGGQVIGKMRVGIRAMSLVAQLATVCRMPVAQIQGLLNTLYRLRLSAGETGWREDGVNSLLAGFRPVKAIQSTQV